MNNKAEAVERMKMLKMSKQCIDAFTKGVVWESEGIGALYECNDNEKELIKAFETSHEGCLVYHMIHNMTEFGELYTMLYISPNEEEWAEDREDIKNGYALAYVRNVTDEFCSEFGTVAIKPSIGGLVRLG